MNLVTRVWLWAQAILDGMLSALTTRPAGALLTTPSIALFTGATVPAPGSAYGSFTQPTFHGYAVEAITLSGPVNVGTDAQAMIGTVTFIATTGGTISDTVTGYILCDGSATYYGGERFSAPVAFANPGDYVSITVVLPLPFSVINS